MPTFISQYAICDEFMKLPWNILLTSYPLIGCSGAVTRALNKLDGVKTVNADLATEKVDVVTADSITYDTVLATIKKTGKEVVSGKTVA